MTDGISDMLGMREKAKRKPPTAAVGEKAASPSRRILPPRNPAKAPTVSETPSAPAQGGAQSAPQVKAEVAEAVSAAPVERDRRVTLYMAAEADEWLETARLAGRRAGVDASRSAIARMALERLMQQMTHDQIVAELAAKADAAGPTRGRRRL